MTGQPACQRSDQIALEHTTDPHTRLRPGDESDAGNLGRDAGKAAASWMFDGNTTEDTCRSVLRGIEDGDPAILHVYPAPGLSEAGLARDLGLDGEDQLPPDAAAESFWHETERLARQHLAACTTARAADSGKEHRR